jgi:TolB-like protein/Tfp pilus assembly protein PilF
MAIPGGNLTEEKTAEACAYLDKILASPMFVQAERQQRFLRYVATETLAGRAELLKGYTIGVAVFDRESSFDPALDAIVRVEAARLRGKLREYYDSEGRDDSVRFVLPKGNYAVHIEWQGEEPPQTPNSHSTVFPQPIEDRPSLAVLPFVNMSSNAEQEYFADGITDCLITELSRLSGLFVISRQSSFIYKKVVKRAEEIGSELGVKYLLEGSVQRSEEWVRITAQLIDAASGVHVWAERYDRELKDIFALQDDVTRRIATVLQVKLASNEANRFGHEGAPVAEAHDALLRGLERFWVYTQESTEEAKVHFANAVQLDPGYAAAHAWLARALVFQWIFLWEPRDETLELAFEHARAAVDLDPQHPFAYSVLSWVQCWRGQGEASITAGRRAVALDPNNADAYLFHAMALAASDRGAEALRYIENGMRLNPHPSAFYQLALGFCYLVLEKYDEAIAAYRHGIEVTDVFIPNHVWLCAVYTLLGREDEARIQREKVLALTGGRTPAVRVIWLEENLHSRMDDLMQRAGLA